MSFHSVAREKAQFSSQSVKTALLIDDNEFDRKRIKRLNSKLDRPLILEDVPDINAMNNCLNENSFDLIMVDYKLGQIDGLTAIDMIHRHKSNKDAAKIMISDSAEIDIAVSALKRGYSDFMSKKELTQKKFQQSIYEALRTARPDFAANPKDVGATLRDAFVDQDLKSLVQQAVTAAMAVQDQSKPMYLTTYDQSDLSTLVLDMLQDDEFIFRAENP